MPFGALPSVTVAAASALPFKSAAVSPAPLPADAANGIGSLFCAAIAFEEHTDDPYRPSAREFFQYFSLRPAKLHSLPSSFVHRKRPLHLLPSLLLYHKLLF
jgi:hypothetical protein